MGDGAFFERLERRAALTGSRLCVGLDPRPALLLRHGLPTNAAGALELCLRVAHATAEVTLAYKPNIAFFEALGPAGLEALASLIEEIRHLAPVILDAKRGDISTTAEAYARACFDTLRADAVTLNPYLGRDTLTPFLEHEGKGIFLLALTSNPGAAEIQAQSVGGRPLYLRVVDAALRWADASRLGFVAGATDPAGLAAVRAAAPDHWLLAPGVGAQGGDARVTVDVGGRSDGRGILVNTSRAILDADDPGNAARALYTTLSAPPRARPQGLDGVRARLADGLLAAGCVRFGRFTLKSGKISPLYLDLRRLVGYPELLRDVARAYVAKMAPLRFDLVAALPYAALPIGTAVCLEGGWPLVYPRKEVKDYGTRASVEGVYTAGQRVVILDDLATTGLSKLEALERLRAAGLDGGDVVVLIDRESGADCALGEAGFTLHAVFRIGELLDHWAATGALGGEELAAARAFLAAERGV